jgi:hypothetical protein
MDLHNLEGNAREIKLEDLASHLYSYNKKFMQDPYEHLTIRKTGEDIPILVEIGQVAFDNSHFSVADLYNAIPKDLPEKRESLAGMVRQPQVKSSWPFHKLK